MRVLTIGSKGEDVAQWEWFLRGLGYPVTADGVFDQADAKATKRYQRANALKADGKPGPRTFAAAIEMHDFDPCADATALEVKHPKKDSAQWPPRPSFSPLKGNAARVKLFGRFKYERTPTKSNPEKIKVDPSWAKENIVTVRLPLPIQRGRIGGPEVRSVRVHSAIAAQFARFLEALQTEGLYDRIFTWNGSYVPRFVRGSTKTLSNHAWGTAFDINVKWNGLNRTPALADDFGSVRELVPIANRYGFYWGGHYQKRLDGMHFEAARIIK